MSDDEARRAGELAHNERQAEIADALFDVLYSIVSGRTVAEGADIAVTQLQQAKRWTLACIRNRKET